METLIRQLDCSLSRMRLSTDVQLLATLLIFFALSCLVEGKAGAIIIRR